MDGARRAWPCHHALVPGPISYWLRDPAPPDVAAPPLQAGDEVRADVAIVGGGFTGLWTAIALTDTDPGLRVAVLEMATVGFGASGRNGGFCEASLTHGLSNGVRHFPDEVDRLEREGIDNLAGLIAFTREHGIDCDLEETGVLALADQPGRSMSSGPGSTTRPSTVSASSSSTAMPPGRRSIRRCGTRACTARPGATCCSTRPSCAVASPGSRGSGACASTKARG
jgi:hypothetical protein